MREKLEKLLRIQLADEQAVIKKIIGCVDLTSLEGKDNHDTVMELCKRAKQSGNVSSDIPCVAAVCVYPTLVRGAKSGLLHTGIHVASVAGGFPAGQTNLGIKLDEVKYALDEGADEIDTVISRGKFLEGEVGYVYDEIAAVKQLCGEIHLKVILETGELITQANIKAASETVISAGADFIKTSTGKIKTGATLEAFLVMLNTVKDHYEKTGKRIGIKAAGGISTPEDALNYYKLVMGVLGESFLTPQYFRIGASRLVDALLDSVQ